jgi:hypothetical protein
MKNKFLLTLLVALLPLTTPIELKAKGEDSGVAGVIKFSCLAWEPLSIPELFYRDGKDYLPLELAPGNRSQLYPMKSGNTLELYVKVDGVSTYKLVGKAPWLAGARRMLFLVDPVSNCSGMPLRIFGVNDALDVFPPGTFRFLNFSNATLHVKFAGQVHKLPVGEITVVKSNVSERGGFIPFQMGDSNGKTIFETRLFSQPSGREMVFIGNPAEPEGLPRVKFVTEIIPKEPPKPKD